MSAQERVDRREFMVGVAATGLAVTLPVALAVSTPAVGAPAPAPAPSAALADWHVDDMWGVYPRPHEAVGFGRPHGDGERVAAVHQADLAFGV